jgi:hypothetical protein
VLCLPAPDWIATTLEVTGPTGLLANFRQAARGPGLIPWRLAPEEAAEGWAAHLLTAGGLEAAIGRQLAADLATAAAARRDGLMAGLAPAALCLHALVPVPPEVLALGPESGRALRWLWEHWGTTWPLRGVTTQPGVLPRRVRPGWAAVRFDFNAADWSPWQALERIRVRWPGLRFVLRPDHGPEADSAQPAAAAPPDRARRRGLA